MSFMPRFDLRNPTFAGVCLSWVLRNQLGSEGESDILPLERVIANLVGSGRDHARGTGHRG